MSHTRTDARLNVSGHVQLPGPLETAITVHFNSPQSDAVVVFAFPGGGYARGYYDIHHPELDGPTQAEFHASRGRVVIAVDHIGVGDSSIPDLDSITFNDLAAANDATVHEALRLLAAGQLSAALPRMAPRLVVGMGQSMGGCIGIVQQARHRSFDALAVLGYSGARMHLPEPPPGQEMLRYAFHWDEEPESLVDADLGAEPQPWRSPTMPSCVPSMAGSGLIVGEAGAVDVPLFLSVGERDVIEDLHTEPDAFRSADDITLFRLRRSAHMHNFAPTRRVLWRRLEAWISGLENSGLPALAATRRLP